MLLSDIVELKRATEAIVAREFEIQSTSKLNSMGFNEANGWTMPVELVITTYTPTATITTTDVTSITKDVGVDEVLEETIYETTTTSSTATTTINITTTAEQTKTNFIVRSGTSQPVSQCFSGKDPYLSRITVKVNNKTNLQIAKKDPNDKLVPNTSFKLSYNSDMSNPIGTYTTGSNGTVVVENILIKDIYIQEVSVPSYLKLDKTIYKKTLSYSDDDLPF